jgi:hypothetical protein
MPSLAHAAKGEDSPNAAISRQAKAGQLPFMSVGVSSTLGYL